MNKLKQKAIVVLGPTSSGKSDLAIKLAKRFKGEIISADSRQIYRHLNQGTGKILGTWEKEPEGKRKVFASKNIPHHLIDFLPLRQSYSVAQFKVDCERLLSDISSRKKLPIICGGTGFWIAAVTDGLIFPKIKPNKSLRIKLEKKSTKNLFEDLKKIDPRRAEKIDSNNKQRLIRALEICTAIGRVPQVKSKPHPEFDFLKIGLFRTKEELNQKIQSRLKTRWLNGMIKEVQELNKNHKLSWKKIQSFGLAYYWIPLYLQGEINLATLKEKVYLAEKNYAKRQRTWFKRDLQIHWLSSEEEIFNQVANFIQKSSL
ncbi:MAG TPA: tRNA (adenosine(37)-N6)-dimethylallyltransferase MiaA [Candidatus Moranbacteria bacterium]|nr:tRNA (adenosine(37)-N6)-dimethylallyltransferase MiaA [Candidatus Moranbacteria bacterium]